MVCATSKGSDQPAQMRSLIRAFDSRLYIKLLTEHHLEFLNLKSGYTGSSGSSLVNMPHCWKPHVAAQLYYLHQKPVDLKHLFSKIDKTWKKWFVPCPCQVEYGILFIYADSILCQCCSFTGALFGLEWLNKYMYASQEATVDPTHPGISVITPKAAFIHKYNTSIQHQTALCLDSSQNECRPSRFSSTYAIHV